MAHWPRVRLTALLTAEAISSRFESTRTLERAKSGELRAGNHYRVGRKAGTRWEKCFGGEKKENNKEKKEKERNSRTRGMKCLRRPLVAVPPPPRKLNSAREIERGNSTRFVAALLPRGSEFHFLPSSAVICSLSFHLVTREMSRTAVGRFRTK